MTLSSLTAEAIIDHMISNPFQGMTQQCDRKECHALAVPGEFHECRDHQIETWLEIMANIVSDPDITDDACGVYSVGMDELERLVTSPRSETQPTSKG